MSTGKNKPYKPKGGKSYKVKYTAKKVDVRQEKQLQKLTKEVNKLKTEPEVKYHWNYEVAEAPNELGVNYYILDIVQGDDYNQRIGEEIMLKREEWIINVIMPAATSSLRYRVIHYMDRQVNGNPPALLGSVSITAGLLDDTVIIDTQYSPINPRCSERYQIFSDKTYIFNRQASDISERHTIRAAKTFNTKIKYSGSGGSVANITSKCSYLAVFADSTTAPGTYDIAGKTYFTDS